jgi:NTE family protein
VLSFVAEDFDDESRREAIYNAAVASAAFPIVFAPVDMPGLGPCYDGGVVNDTPVRLAAEAGAERVIVIAPYPTLTSHGKLPTGINLVMHLVDILIHERLYRDLHEAARLNEAVSQLMALVDAKQLTIGQLQKVLAIVNAKPIEMITIRPENDLPGNTFAGFLDRNLRSQYVAAGQAAAERTLARITR